MRKLKRSAGGGSRSWRLITLLAGSVVLCLHLLLPALRAASLWGAEAAAGRVAAPVAWELPPGPAQLDGADLPVLFLAVASKGLQEFILNWVQGVRSIQVPYVLASLDNDTLGMLRDLGLPYLHVPGLVLDTEDSYEGHYRRMRAAKAAVTHLTGVLLRQGAARVVVASDLDIAWVKHPGPYLDAHPEADWFQSTDCLSAVAEAGRGAVTHVMRCGHTRGNTWYSTYNAGMYMVRARRASIRMLAAWEAALDTGPLYTEQGWVIDDQFAINQLLPQGSMPIEEVAPGGGLGAFDAAQVAGVGSSLERAIVAGGGPLSAALDGATIWALNRTLRLNPLPVLLFPPGHAAFSQRLPQRHGVQPFAYHATFQPFGAAGKRARFREWGLWRVDPGEYYTGRYLAYDNAARHFVEAYSQRYEAVHSRPVVPMHRHLVGMAWQRAALRDAMALGRVLNRTVVLPTLWCWCDTDQSPFVLQNCTMEGTDAGLPYACPADGLIDPGAWDKADAPYRLAGFLAEWARRAAGGRVALAEVGPGIDPGGDAFLRATPEDEEPWQRSLDEAAVEGLVQQQAGGPAAAIAEVQPGDGEAGMQAALAPARDADVLALRGMAPAVFRGFIKSGADAAFDDWFSSFAGWADWCCGGAGGGAPRNVFLIQRPRPLAQGWERWRAPVVRKPEWCGDVDEENKPYVAYKNHPCTWAAEP